MAEATDAAVKLAAEHNIDLEQVDGTGSEGKIVTEDVQSVVQAIEVAKSHGYDSESLPVNDEADDSNVNESDLLRFTKKVAANKATSRSRLAREARAILQGTRQ